MNHMNRSRKYASFQQLNRVRFIEADNKTDNKYGNLRNYYECI